MRYLVIQRHSRQPRGAFETRALGRGRGQAPGLRQGPACSAIWSATAPIPTRSASACASSSPTRLIRGNHDKVGSGLESPEGFNAVARNAIRWTYDNLSKENRDWLAALPAGPMIVDDMIEICHGTPFDEDAYIFDDLDALRAMHAARRPLCLFGHTHVQVGHYLSRDQFGLATSDEHAAADDCARGTRTATWSTPARSASRATAIRAPASASSTRRRAR